MKCIIICCLMLSYKIKFLTIYYIKDIIYVKSNKIYIIIRSYIFYVIYYII